MRLSNAHDAFEIFPVLFWPINNSSWHNPCWNSGLLRSINALLDRIPTWKEIKGLLKQCYASLMYCLFNDHNLLPLKKQDDLHLQAIITWPCLSLIKQDYNYSSRLSNWLGWLIFFSSKLTLSSHQNVLSIFLWPSLLYVNDIFFVSPFCTMEWKLLLYKLLAVWDLIWKIG